MKHSEPLILNKEEFFEGFDNPSLQEKVVGIKIALLQNDNGEIGLGLGIEAPPLHSREIEEINRFFAKKYNAGEMMQKLLQHYQDQRSQNADRKSQSDQKYEITDIAHPQYPWLHRIRALQDVREDVHQGDLGGFVESERNLSQEAAGSTITRSPGKTPVSLNRAPCIGPAGRLARLSFPGTPGWIGMYGF